MVNIQESKILDLDNLISYRGILSPSQLEGIGHEMERFIMLSGARKIGYPIMATFAENNGLIDVEMLLQIDKVIESNEKFIFKKKLYIENAIVAQHIGNPIDLNSTMEVLNKYIMKNGYVPISVCYNVTSYIDPLDITKTELNIYVSISPNII